MLYNVEINKDVAKDRNKLVETLYIFLRRYIRSKLIYEDSDTIEDCVQDTIMHILRRYDELVQDLSKESKHWDANFNFGKYFYNRARSYSSYWIRRINKDRKAAREYMEDLMYYTNLYDKHSPEPIMVDYQLLERVVDSYGLNEELTQGLLMLSEQMLNQAGYNTEPRYSAYTIDLHKPVLEKLVYIVVDEYMVETLKEGGV